MQLYFVIAANSMRCLICKKCKILVVFLTEHEFWLTYKCSKGGFQVLSVPVGKTVGLIFFISGCNSEFSRAIPREPGAQEDQTNRWTEITRTTAVEEGHLFGELHNSCGSLSVAGRWLSRGVILGAARWEGGDCTSPPLYW